MAVGTTESIEYRGSACLEVGSALRADLVTPFSAPDLHDCLKVGRPLPWPPFDVARATTGQSHRPYQPRSAHGRDSDHVPTSRHWLKGKPETGGMAGEVIFRSRVSAVGYLVRVFRFGYGFRKSAIGHLSSIQSSTQHSNHFGWRVAAPGGRWRD